MQSCIQKFKKAYSESFWGRFANFDNGNYSSIMGECHMIMLDSKAWLIRSTNVSISNDTTLLHLFTFCNFKIQKAYATIKNLVK